MTRIATMLCAMVLTWSGAVAHALTIEHDLVDLRPLFPPRVEIALTGPIEAGDSDRLAAVLERYEDPAIRDIRVTLDSPGGNLFEGLMMAWLLMDRPEIVSATVGSDEGQPAECASACVLTYLGADLRYLPRRARIGVHQFSFVDDTLPAQNATGPAQSMSALIVDLMRHQDVDTALFRRMSATDPNGIDWIDRRDLEAWGVVTGDVAREWMEYRNIDGKVALRMVQVGILGTNEMTLVCGDGLVGYAVLDEPERAMMGAVKIVIDGREHRVENVSLVDRTNNRTRVFFGIPDHAARLMRDARTVGARVHVPSGALFWGFEQTVKDARLREMVESCVPAPAPAPAPMRVVGNLDFLGNDLLLDGIRGISFLDCQARCEREPACRAITYVVSKRWCWPKSRARNVQRNPAVISAVK